MAGKSFHKQTLYVTLFFVVVASQILHTTAHYINTKKVHLNSTEVESLLEYHFHTYFDAHDPVQVAQAIELRNEIVANCVAKKIIAIPQRYHYDPENPVLEGKFYMSCNILTF